MSESAAVDLVRALVQNTRRAADGWESASYVIEIDTGYLSCSGSTYGPGDTISPVSARPTAIEESLDAYLASHVSPDSARPVSLLVQLDRASGMYEITFEDTDRSRWKVTPMNFREMREELRPRFGEQSDPAARPSA